MCLKCALELYGVRIVTNQMTGRLVVMLWYNPRGTKLSSPLLFFPVCVGVFNEMWFQFSFTQLGNDEYWRCIAAKASL